MNISLEKITEPTLIRYFSSLNAGDFTTTSQLFTEDGVMYPPLESSIIGKEAIAKYLHEEAQDIKAEPQQVVNEELVDNHILFKITGLAHTSWCSVNVLWLFILNPNKKILEAKIKLLASPQDLLALRPPDKEYTELPEFLT